MVFQLPHVAPHVPRSNARAQQSLAQFTELLLHIDLLQEPSGQQQSACSSLLPDRSGAGRLVSSTNNKYGFVHSRICAVTTGPHPAPSRAIPGKQPPHLLRLLNQSFRGWPARFHSRTFPAAAVILESRVPELHS